MTKSLHSASCALYVGPVRAEEPSISVIRTKLYRPPVAPDVVCRRALHERLDEGLRLSLTLVSAPAGYGKSTLISHWMESCGQPSAWLSLEEGDSDPRVFLTYVIAAVRTIEEGACANTAALLDSGELPCDSALVACLATDFEAMDGPFVLVLDDYHRLSSTSVHDLLAALLDHPPRQLHLVIVTRRNPSLRLDSLRAGGHMNEIRLTDLEFSQDETAALLQQTARHTLDSAALAHVHKKTEGWAVGLRLATLAMRYHEDANSFLRSFDGDTRQVQDYLMAEVLEHQQPVVRDCLCKISILDRFCAPLCEAVCDSDDRPGDGTGCDGTFASMLTGSGLLCIALDDQGQWYRFHHLFQDLLSQQLTHQLGAVDIAGLNVRAAEWLEDKGYLEEAAHHLVKAGNVPAIRALILRYRRTLYREEQWLRFDTLLSTLPTDVINADPEILMIKAWVCIIRQMHTEIWGIVERTEALLENQPCSDERESVFGQLDIFLSWRSYAAADGDSALAYAESAVERLPLGLDIERGYAQVMVAVSLQMVGREAEAIQYIYDAMEKERHAHASYRVRLLEALGFVTWMAGDLAGLRDAGSALIRLGEKESLPISVYNGHYRKGKALYALGELEPARDLLSSIVKPGYRATDRFLIGATHFLALTYEALGQPDLAFSLLEDMTENLMDDANSYSLLMVKAFQAELALLQGRLADAERWLATFEPSPTPRGDVSSNDELTAVKILLRQRTPASLKKAAGLLKDYVPYFETIHNTRFLIEALALQALVEETCDRASHAMACLERAIRLALPCGFIRLFVDLGPEMSRLLNRLTLDEEGLRYVGRIQAAYRGASAHPKPSRAVTRTPEASGLLDPLTKRENEILALLTERRTNMEIAETLCISVKTVRRHTENLYGKLGVHGRHEAVAKAEGLGILIQG